MGKITVEDVEKSAIEVHGAGQYVSAALAASVIEQQAETIDRYEEHIKILADYSESPNATGDRAVTEANRMLVLHYNRNKQTRGW